MKRLPLGIQTFRRIITDGYVYVDKTQYVYDLINDATYYFLSRPRRFGKSLLLDTIGEAFSGDKELFKGLFIYDTDYVFEKHPVLRLDMSNIGNESPEILKKSLSKALMKRVKKEGLDTEYDIPAEMFKNLIEDLYDKYDKRVVVLIDEYDKPILDHLDNIETAEANRNVLRSFYGILKSMDPYLRLTFITGVTKFTKTSIFSELNNLYDITLAENYSSICGIAIEDLYKYFDKHIEDLSSNERFKRYTCTSIHDEILAWYDGYSWDGAKRVINPYSLLSFFSRKTFSSFWYASGSPKFLMDLIKKSPEGYANLKNLVIGEWTLDTFDIENIQTGALLFQTGYLTVKEIPEETGSPVYLLGIPNFEVREAFNLHILSEFTESGAQTAETAYRSIKQALKTGDLQSMLETLRGLFASIPYELHIGCEAYYHSIFYAILNLFGFETDAEVSVSGGRIDSILELDDKVYILELKYAPCPSDAMPEEKQSLFEKALDDGMAQIKDKGYAKKYVKSGKKVYLVAFAFLGRDAIEMRVESV